MNTSIELSLLQLASNNLMIRYEKDYNLYLAKLNSTRPTLPTSQEIIEYANQLKASINC